MTKTTAFLELWGWRDFFATQLQTPLEGSQIARITKEQRDHYVLINGLGTSVGGIIPGKWKKRKDDHENPSVGDWVLLGEKAHSQNGMEIYLIKERLQRFSQILRKAAGLTSKSQLLAANVDVAFLVSSPNQDFDVKRIERYLSILKEGAIRPVLVLNKYDLSSASDCLKTLQERFADLPIITTRSDQPDSIEALKTYLGPGITSVLLGSSGVGKSTLTNLLLGESKQFVQSIRSNDSKGRHTTTGRSLFQINENLGLVIDTPGLREIQLPASEANFEETFSDIFEKALSCRFPDCSHQSEPQCAVKDAVKEGLISKDRLDNFIKLKSETQKRPSWQKK